MIETPSLTWGVVGLGRLVQTQIAPAIRAAGQSIVACVGGSPEKSRKFAAEFAVAHPCASITELAADPQVKAVFIASPNRLHHAHVLEIAAAGKHILCEKPFALSVADAESMVSACAGAGVQLRLGFQIRLEAILQRIRAVVASGVLGELRSLEFERSGVFGARNAWRDDPGQGGALFDIGVHLLDQAEWLTGMRFSEIAAFSHPDRRANQADETVAILGMLGTQCHAVLRASREIPHAQNNLRIQGTEGMLVTSKLRWGEAYNFEVFCGSASFTETFPATAIYKREIEVFEHDLRSGQAMLPTGSDGVRNVKLTGAVLESIATRRSIALD